MKLPKTNEIIYFAETTFRNAKKRFGILPDDRRRHMYIIGKTGMGKTVLEENMMIQDIIAGHGVGVVDPHGEFAESLLDFVPSSRINDVVYLNPADLDFPIAFNVMEKVNPEFRHLVASGLMGVFKKIWPDVWSARMEYILNNAILALLEFPGSTLLGINRMLSDKDYRAKVIDKVTDPVVKSFWITEFARYTQRLESEATAAIQNKVGQFISASLIRNIIGQTKSSIDMREIMDEGKILIMNLSKGLIGEDNSRLLGALLITKLQLAAMSRVNIPEEKRRDFYLYVDEFQNFATESFANILSEARKYRLALILAHQYITQMEETVSDAVFGNVGTLVSFRVGAEDAEFLEKEFAPEFMATDIVNLDKYNIYLKLMVNGVAGHAFSAHTLPPFPQPEKNHREKIINVSRERYGTDRKEVEEKIAKWSGVFTESFVPAPEPPKLYEATCSSCGKKTRVIFEPDPKRPIYCEKCLKEIREKRAQGKGGIQHSAFSSPQSAIGIPHSAFRNPQSAISNRESGNERDDTNWPKEEVQPARDEFRDAVPSKVSPPVPSESRYRGKFFKSRENVRENREKKENDSSLEESIKKPPVYFHKSHSNEASGERSIQDRPQKERAKVNLDDLRKTLEDSLGTGNKNTAGNRNEDRAARNNSSENQVQSSRNNGGNILRPGDRIQF